MSGAAYREGLDGLRVRLGEEMASITERASELGPLRRVLLRDDDATIRAVRDLERDVAEVATIDDAARLLELLQRVERVRHTIEEAIDAAARALADRPPLEPITLEDHDALYATTTHDEIELVGKRVLSLTVIVGAERGKSFNGVLSAAVPRRLPHFAVVSRRTMVSTLASYFGRRVINHAEFDHHYEVTGDIEVVKILLSRSACDALVRVALPSVRLDAQNGRMRLVCGHGARSARTAIAQIPPSAVRALALILKEIEEA